MPKRKKKHLCRTCAEPIDFVLKAGFIPKGHSRFLVVNADDHRPHRARCELRVALKKAKTEGPAQLRRQKKIAHARERAPEGEQLDAFSDQ